MNPLKDHEAVKEMLRLMEENDRQEQAAEFARVIDAVDNMSQQYAKLTNELTEVKERLSEASRLRHPLHDMLSKTVRAVETKADDAFVRLCSVRNRIISCAETAVADFKRMGVSALDQAVATLRVGDLLTAVGEKISAALDSTETSIQKLETMGRELRSAGAHMKNAGRAAGGKEVQPVDGGEAGRIQSAVLAPLRGVHSVLTQFSRTNGKALTAVERLEDAADRNRGKREKSSVRHRLEKKPPALPAPAKKFREAER